MGRDVGVIFFKYHNGGRDIVIIFNFLKLEYGSQLSNILFIRMFSPPLSLLSKKRFTSRNKTSANSAALLRNFARANKRGATVGKQDSIQKSIKMTATNPTTVVAGTAKRMTVFWENTKQQMKDLDPFAADDPWADEVSVGIQGAGDGGGFGGCVWGGGSLGG